jgi:hypothetical protein
LRYAPNRLAWVCLNDAEPLKVRVPCGPRSEKRLDSGQLRWEWCLLPDHDYPGMPWRSYIPRKNDWLREGTQGWVFRKLHPTKFVDPSTTSPSLRIHPTLKSDIQLTFRVIQLICNDVVQVYHRPIPTHLMDGLRTIAWLNDDYVETSSLLSVLWDARRCLLECYGWVSYRLFRDSQPWRERKWGDHFVNLVDKILRFLTAPKRGCIIDPASISTEEVVALVQDEVPIHYQWKARSDSSLVDAWATPSPAASRFDPYEFQRVYDRAAYIVAGGPFNNSAKDRAVLGRAEAGQLAVTYLRQPPRRELPEPADPGTGGKAKLRFFAREHVGDELIEISKKIMADLVDDEAGTVIEKKHRWGDMKLLTLHSSPSLHVISTDLTKFFDAIDQFSMAVDMPNLPEPHAPPLASAVPDVIMQEGHDTTFGNAFKPPDPIAPSLTPTADIDVVQGAESDYTLAVQDIVDMQEERNIDISINPINPLDASAPLLALIMPEIANPQKEQDVHTFASCAPAPADAMSVDPIFGCSAEQMADYKRGTDVDDDVVSLGEETHASQSISQCGFCYLERDDFVPSPSSSTSIQHPAHESNRSASPHQTCSPRGRSPSSSSRSLRSHGSPIRMFQTTCKQSQSPRRGSPQRRHRLSPSRYGRSPPRRRSLSPRQSSSNRRYSSNRRSPSPRRGSPRRRHRSPPRRRLLSPRQTSSNRRYSSNRRSPSPRRRHRLPPSHYRRSPSRRRSLSPRQTSPNQTCSSNHQVRQPTPATSCAAHQDAAIAFIQASFALSRTNTTFAGLPVNIDHITPSPISGLLRQEGHLTVPASTELRMRYWHIFNPKLSVLDLLIRCLMKGLPYNITLPPTSSLARSSTALQRPLRQIRQARGEKVSMSMVAQYLDNVQVVLSRPHAHKFLERGGLIWRIVRQYAPQVYAEALIGPRSNEYTNYNKAITPDEIQTLLGVTTNCNSFWPYPEWYERSNRYNGEWTTANEAWFIKHVEDIGYAREGSLRGGRFWQNTIHVHTSAMISDVTVSGTMAHAQACCTHLVREWPELWDAFNISCLT